MLIFGDENGNIVIADRDFHVSERRNKVFKGKVRGLAYLLDPQKSNRQYIIAIGEDARPGESASAVYTIKVFSTADFSRPLTVLNATVPDASMTAFAVQADGNEIAVGYSNGRVLLFVGQFLKDSSQTRLTASPPIALLDRHTYAVSSLDFCEAPSKTEDRSVRLFVTLDTKHTSMESEDELMAKVLDEDDIEAAGIIVYDTSYANNNKTLMLNAIRDPKALDGRGASSLCSTFMRSTGELILARNEAVCAYTLDDRAGAMAITGEKICLSSVGRYALVVSIEDKAATATTGISSSKRRPLVTIYDLKNKIICGTVKRFFLPVNEKIQFVLHDGGVVYLVTSSWSLIRFREKDTMKKLDVLLALDPPLYSLAITIAGEEQLEGAEIMKLYKSYGDHLFGKHDFDNAIVQYCNTVGYLPSSYVIIKYLDPYRIGNLILYLEKLKDKALAASDHLTLLLSCYCKLKAEPAIAQLIDHVCTQAGKMDSNSNKKALFDSSMAIKLLSSAGFIESALRIALRFQQHKAYLDIQLNKMPAPYDDILGYVVYCFLTATSEEVLGLLQAYGRDLLAARGKAFTQLMIHLCTGEIYSIVQSIGKTSSSSSSSSMPAEVSKALQSIVMSSSHPSLLITTSAVAAKELLCPSQCTLIFVDDSANLLFFLETVVTKLAKTKIFPPKVWNTLLELYMQMARQSKLDGSGSGSGEVSQYESSILNILDGPNASYSLPHILLLCYIYDFTQGIVYLLEKSNNIYLLLDIYIQQHNANDLFKLLRKLTNKQPELFVKVLTYFVQKTVPQVTKQQTRPAGYDSDDDVKEEPQGEAEEQEDDESKWDAIMDLLDLIEKESILSPAQVLNILALNPRLPLRVVSQYINSSFRDMSDGLQGVEEKMQDALKQLESAATSATAVHEVKPHPKVDRKRSGYDDYDDEDEDEDEDTRKRNEENDKNKWLDIRRSHIQRAGEHEKFFRELEISTDGFSTVADYFGLTVISYNNS